MLSDNLLWENLTKHMAVHGIQCINWPEDVPFPGECAPHTKRRLRFRELTVDALARLATAFNQTGAEAPTFVPVGRFGERILAHKDCHSP